jgi:two-component system, chemotaxis family, chemotaxis protein CheY
MGQRILIVDDSKAMRLIVRRTLRQAGFGAAEMDEAADGVEALAKIESFRPTLVLSDWNMPTMNGYELLTEIVKRKLSVRFGFVTTEGTPDMRARAVSAGAGFVIEKPFTPERFREVLGPLLGE